MSDQKIEATIIVTDDQIMDCRHFPRGTLESLVRKASLDDYKFLYFNGFIVWLEDERSFGDNVQDAIVFFPPDGFWTKESLPFVGWADGFEYSGESLWLQCDESINGSEIIPLRK